MNKKLLDELNEDIAFAQEDFVSDLQNETGREYLRGYRAGVLHAMLTLKAHILEHKEEYGL
jgi:hypothetical protein